MRLGTVTQQSGERKAYSITYDKALDEGDEISSVLSCTASSEELEVSPVLASESRVRVWVQGGVSGATYTITVRVETAGGEILEDELICRVKDV